MLFRSPLYLGKFWTEILFWKFQFRQCLGLNRRLALLVPKYEHNKKYVEVLHMD